MCPRCVVRVDAGEQLILQPGVQPVAEQKWAFDPRSPRFSRAGVHLREPRVCLALGVERARDLTAGAAVHTREVDDGMPSAPGAVRATASIGPATSHGDSSRHDKGPAP